MERLRAAISAIEDHSYAGFYDWFGIAELLDAARDVVAANDQT